MAEKRVDLAYNAIGQFTSIARYKDTDGGTANEVATAAYWYDTLGRLTSLAYTKGGSNLFTPYSWTYDSLSSPGMDFGETPTVADPRVSATGASAVFAGLGRITQMVSQDGTSTYGYDSKSQLTSATHSYQSNETYSFDNNGNRTMTGYQTGTDNRLTNDGTYSYTYDAEGNRLTRTKTATGEVTEYTWDYHNRLTKVTEKNSQGTVTQVVEYIYDVFNRRIGRKIDTSAPFDMANAVIERYVLDDIHNGLASADGGNVVLDFVDPDGSGAQAIAMSKRYLYGEAVDQLFAQEDLSKTLGDATRNLWPLVDHLGTVRDLAKQDGTIAAHYKYDSFGNVTSPATRPRPATSSPAANSTRPPNSSTIARGTTMPPSAAGSARIRWGSRRGMRMWGGMSANVLRTTDPSGMFEEPAFYRLRRESEPGDYFYPGRNPGEGFWEFCLRSISLTMSNPSFQGSMAIGGPGSNFGGARNLNLRLKTPTEEPIAPTNPPPGRQGVPTKPCA